MLCARKDASTAAIAPTALPEDRHATLHTCVLLIGGRNSQIAFAVARAFLLTISGFRD